jgi:hypothetical protein
MFRLMVDMTNKGCEESPMDEPLKRGKDFITVGGQELEVNKGTGNREKNVGDLRDEALIKQYEAATESEIIRKKAVDLLGRRIASGDLSTSMLLRIVMTLAKSTEALAVAALSASTGMASATGAPKSSGSSPRSGGGSVDYSITGSGAAGMSSPSNPNPPI